MRVPEEPKLLGPVRIRQLARDLNVMPTKKLGQNFVIDPGTVRKIVADADLRPGEQTLEVGPGLGSLTMALLEQGAKVTAIEIDPILAGALPETIAQDAPDWAPSLTVVNEDALAVEASMVDQAPTALVANLPYNVAVPIILHLLAQFPTLEKVLVMVQREVAERLVAGPGSRTYGVPSVKLAWYGPSHYAGTIGRKVFWPAPNVDSALVRLQVSHPFGVDRALRDRVFVLVDAAFSQRRKMIRVALKPAFATPEALASALRGAELSGTERAEDLSVETFVRLAAGTQEG